MLPRWLEVGGSAEFAAVSNQVRITMKDALLSLMIVAASYTEPEPGKTYKAGSTHDLGARDGACSRLVSGMRSGRRRSQHASA